MNMPGYTADASVYQTTNPYRSTGGTSLTDGSTIVAPQGCGLGRGALCGGGIALGSALCVGFCLDPLLGPGACYACWASALPGALLAFCKDCIPAAVRSVINAFESSGASSGGVGAGSTGCCPRGGMKCCGSCNNPSKKCDDVCVLRGQPCP